MLRVLTSIVIVAVISAAPLALTAGTADAAKSATKICKHKTASGKVEDLAVRRGSAVLFGKDDQLLHVWI